LATREVNTPFAYLCFIAIFQDLQVTDQSASLQSFLVPFLDVREVEKDII